MLESVPWLDCSLHLGNLLPQVGQLVRVGPVLVLKSAELRSAELRSVALLLVQQSVVRPLVVQPSVGPQSVQPWVQSLSSADLSVQESLLRYRPSALVSVAVSAPT